MIIRLNHQNTHGLPFAGSYDYSEKDLLPLNLLGLYVGGMITFLAKPRVLRI
jgi:hypothetical protein